ncbi:MAG: type II toxin-antitoxin system VapC family toxin [Planctomycetaceae bacterium]|nr:type II toxin-antitoxin system VapC family toxin [Planctomycetaceae bacterium]
MNVIDSSCWLEFAEKSPVERIVAPIIADAKNLLVPTIVLYEVFKKLTATRGVVYANEFVQGMLKARVVPLDVELSLCAAHISRDYKLPTADSIIYAVVKQHDAVLWTTDQHFDGLPNVRYFNKTQQ